MKKKEVIYREMLVDALGRKTFSFTQLGLSIRLGVSLSTVNNALAPLERTGIIEKRTRSFSIMDVKKFLVFWATVRALSRDITYSTRANKEVLKIESEMPPGTIFTSYSGYRMLFNETPADYSEVYVYANDSVTVEIRDRFPEQGGPKNIFVLKKDEHMPAAPIAPLPQIYVDLWNMKEWYAKEFVDAFEKRLFE